jgi:hypothetical protein
MLRHTSPIVSRIRAAASRMTYSLIRSLRDAGFVVVVMTPLSVRKPPERGDSTAGPEGAQTVTRGEDCMYAPVSECSGPARATGFRNDEDVKDVLVCRAHYGRLRKLNGRDADELEQYLLRAFAGRRIA